MSTAVVEPQQTPPEEPLVAAPETSEAERGREDLFEFSRWLHVGEGALACSHNVQVADEGKEPYIRATGKCTDPAHFHAWIRLPNQFQIRDIVEKARAASARRKKLLRDHNSDAAAVLDGELDEIRDESLKPVLVEEILEESYYEVFRQATRNVEERDDEDAEPDPESGEIPKLYAHIDQDREEYQRQQALPEDQRDGDEFAALEQRNADYSRAVTTEIEELQKPRRETLEARSMDDLLALVRTRRVNEAATEVYLHTFNTWQWYVCTFKGTPSGIPRERVFSDISVFRFDTPRDVISALSENFGALEAKLARGRGLGNS